jgi:pyridoxine 5-phosphate synthase
LASFGVNIDHIATLRNARGDFFPSLAFAAGIVELNGGDFITIHLREDRRHIRDEDLFLLKQTVSTYLNLEMACNDDVLEKALRTKPYKVSLVPERREEVTTEGGLDIKNNFSRIKDFVSALKSNNIKVSLFIEGNIQDIDLFAKTGADEVEIHTGKYSLCSIDERPSILKDITDFSRISNKAGLKVCAGHGLTYNNVGLLCRIKEIEEFNIGYSIITRAIFDGLGTAVKEMKRIINESSINL